MNKSFNSQRATNILEHVRTEVALLGNIVNYFMKTMGINQFQCIIKILSFRFCSNNKNIFRTSTIRRQFYKINYLSQIIRMMAFRSYFWHALLCLVLYQDLTPSSTCLMTGKASKFLPAKNELLIFKRIVILMTMLLAGGTKLNTETRKQHNIIYFRNWHWNFT